MTTPDIFDHIYRDRLWGTADRPFCSGGGTVTRDVSIPYVDAIRRLIQGKRAGSFLISAAEIFGSVDRSPSRSQSTPV
jgi:hypothetical protein